MEENQEIKEFVEFKDFIFLNSGEVQAGLNTIIYLKVFEDHNKTIYLGSLRIGLYHSYSSESLKKCINYILSTKFPTYYAYELNVTKI